MNNVGHKTMTLSLPEKSDNELQKIGEKICHGRDWRWVVMWSYNIHKRFRNLMLKREIWDELDKLIQKEWDWHLGRKLFEDIRQVALTLRGDNTEDTYLSLGEIVAKSISNASWDPGLYDYHAPWRVPSLAIHLARELGDEKLLRYFDCHFTSCADNRHSDKPQKRANN